MLIYEDVKTVVAYSSCDFRNLNLHFWKKRGIFVAIFKKCNKYSFCTFGIEEQRRYKFMLLCKIFMEFSKIFLT